LSLWDAKHLVLGKSLLSATGTHVGFIRDAILSTDRSGSYAIVAERSSGIGASPVGIFPGDELTLAGSKLMLAHGEENDRTSRVDLPTRLA
jgi:hypothetical protein